MLCTGYNNRLNEFKILNSWGEGWGNSGYFYMRYNDFMNYVNEAYVAYESIASAIPISRLIPATSKNIPKKDLSLINDSTNEFSSWFKVGYYHTFDSLNIGLNYLNKSTGQCLVSFTQEESEATVESILLNLGETKSFYYNNNKINFTFLRIGKAGLNPFKPAVYFTVISEHGVADSVIKYYLNKVNQN